MAQAHPLTKKIKVQDNRQFNEDWKLQYFFTFSPGVNAIPLCLICYKTIACIRKHDLQRHYLTNHKNFEQEYPIGSEEREHKLSSLLQSYTNSSKIMMHSTTLQERTTEASLRVS